MFPQTGELFPKGPASVRPTLVCDLSAAGAHAPDDPECRVAVRRAVLRPFCPTVPHQKNTGSPELEKPARNLVPYDRPFDQARTEPGYVMQLQFEWLHHRSACSLSYARRSKQHDSDAVRVWWAWNLRQVQSFLDH